MYNVIIKQNQRCICEINHNFHTSIIPPGPIKFFCIIKFGYLDILGNFHSQVAQNLPSR
jgi:hypothetical protein